MPKAKLSNDGYVTDSRVVPSVLTQIICTKFYITEQTPQHKAFPWNSRS